MYLGSSSHVSHPNPSNPIRLQHICNKLKCNLPCHPMSIQTTVPAYHTMLNCSTHRHTHAHTHRHTQMHTHRHTYLDLLRYIKLSMCVCVLVCVCVHVRLSI